MSKDDLALKNESELYLFFRKSCLSSQGRFAELMDLSKIPRVFLHGNPHIDNFAKTENGEAMIDFDRSRHGPYAWDLVRLFGSIALRQKKQKEGRFLKKSVVRACLEGYFDGFEYPNESRKRPHVLPDHTPNPDDCSMRSYLENNRSWARKMRMNPIDPGHEMVRSMVELYFQGRNELLNEFKIIEAGSATGSLGKPRILVVLEPHPKQTPGQTQDLLLLDIKEVYQDEDSAFFSNPYHHHGLRMIEASFLHTPDFEKRLGYLTWNGNQFWARQVPYFKAKIKGNLKKSLQQDFAYVVGLQLGRAHRLSLKEATPSFLLKHLRENLPLFLELSAQLNDEITRAWEQNQNQPLIQDTHHVSP